MSDELTDQLPDDLDVAQYVGPYQFPDNSRRRIPGVLYLAIGLTLVVFYLLRSEDAVLLNGGILGAAVLLAAVGLFSLSSGWKMTVDETQALEAASEAIGFAVGHASAQQVWRGLRSRPTWRVLCYSAEEPPTRRGLVLVDAVDGRVVEHLVQDNPESWG